MSTCDHCEVEMDTKKLERTLNEILSNYETGDVTGVTVNSTKTSIRITIETVSKNDVIEIKKDPLSD